MTHKQDPGPSTPISRRDASGSTLDGGQGQADAVHHLSGGLYGGGGGGDGDDEENGDGDGDGAGGGGESLHWSPQTHGHGDGDGEQLPGDPGAGHGIVEAVLAGHDFSPHHAPVICGKDRWPAAAAISRKPARCL